MSALVGTESLADGKQVIVVHADDYAPAKRIFRDFSVVGCNGEDTDMSAIMGKPCVLIGQAAAIHAGLLHAAGSAVKVIDDDLDPYLEHIHALQWAKERAYLYQPSTASAQDSSPPSVTPFSDSEDTATDATLPEMPAHIAESLPVEALGYPLHESTDDRPSVIEWPELQDIFQSATCAEFQHGYLPSFLSDYCMDVSQRQGTSPAFTAVGLVVSLSGACDPAFRFQPMLKDHEWKVIPALWGMAVGPSSAGKDPALKSAFNHLMELDRKRSIEVIEKDKEYSRKHRRWLKQEQDWINAKDKDGIGNDMFLIPEPKREPDKCLVYTDITPQALQDFLQHHPRGAFVFAAEASQWVGSMDAYSKGAGERPWWLMSYDGGPAKGKRIGRGEFPIPNLLTRVLGGITPAALRASLGKGTLNEDGLLQRMLLGIGGPQGRGEDREPDVKSKDIYCRVLERLIDWDGDKDLVIRSSSGAYECLQEFIDELRQLQMMRESSTGLVSHFGKMRGMVARLALILHLTYAAAQNKYPSYDQTLSTGTMEQAVAFMRWQIDQVTYFWDSIIGGVGAGETAEQKLGLYILAKGASVLTNRDIEGAIRADWSFPDLSQSARVLARKKILENLNEAGWLSSRLDGARKFQGYSTVHDVNPAVHTQFARLAGDERERREAIARLLANKRAEAAARRGE